jgi:death-on-curing protein
LLEAALTQPLQAFGGIDLYPRFLLQVACLGFSLIQNHPFVDGNKRIGHAAMEVMILNGLELSVDVDDAEFVVLGVATGLIDRDALMHWLEEHQIPSVAG